MKTITLSNRPCWLHQGQRSATCGDCHFLALKQQHAQLARERVQAHAQYLAKERGLAVALEFLRTSRQHLLGDQT